MLFMDVQNYMFLPGLDLDVNRSIFRTSLINVKSFLVSGMSVLFFQTRLTWAQIRAFCTEI